MKNKQAVEILTQGINLAVGAGAYKNSKDVAILAQALETVSQMEQSYTNLINAPVSEDKGAPLKLAEKK